MRRQKVNGMARLLSKSDNDYGLLVRCPSWGTKGQLIRRSVLGRREAIEKQRHINGQPIFFQRLQFEDAK
jgi:hypothetical protein